jgi:haloalkane dehalogenase
VTIHPNDVLLPRIAVRDSFMAYRTLGDDPDAPAALFLHGNPTSSYIWRHIMERVALTARCIAPDLIGFGQSGKPSIDYRFTEIAAYLDDFVEVLGLTSVYLVAQDWGTAFALRLAARRPEIVRGLALMEFIRPMATWSDFHQVQQARETFQALRTPEVGEGLIYDQNIFIERILPGSTERTLAPDELDVYRLPFTAESDRTPMLRLPRELPIEGSPADVHTELTAAHQALRESTYPKLLFAGDPGALVNPAQASEFAQTLTNISLVQLPSGRHYLQEDHPTEIGDAVAQFIATHHVPTTV